MKKKQEFKRLKYCTICDQTTCPKCGCCWSKDCIECKVRLALEALDRDKTNTPSRGLALARCIEKVLPKMSPMDAKIIKERKGNIAYLRQAHAFLSPYIRELRLLGWSEGEPLSIIDQKAKGIGIVKEIE